MSANYELIRSQIDELDVTERIQLLSELFELLSRTEQIERTEKWATVAESRLAEYDNNQTAGEDWPSLRDRLYR
jgi:hypothetical protein